MKSAFLSKGLPLVALTVSLGSLAHADALRSTMNGTGTIRFSGQDTRINRATVDLQNNGRAQVTLEGNRKWVFDGIWKGDGFNRFSLNVQGISTGPRMGGSPLGKGTITVRDRRLTSLSISGKIGRDSYSADFNANNNGGGIGNPGGRDVIGDYSATGTLRLANGNTHTIKRVRFSLRADGSAEVGLIGTKYTFGFYGTWRRGTSNDYTVDLKRNDGDGSARGEFGTRGNSTIPDDLKLTGRWKSDNFSANVRLNR